MNVMRRIGVQFFLLVLLAVGVGANSGVAQDAPPSQEVRNKPTLTESTIPSARHSSRARRGPQRLITATDVKKVIAVATDVSPEWGAQLEILQKDDPDQLMTNIRSSGHRLLGLVMLRERDPGLYEVRVGELRCKRELADVGQEYREALRDGRTDDAAALSEAVRALVKQSLDFEMRARAMELAALDKAVRELKAQLEEEVATRNERLEQRFQEVIAVE